MDQATQTMIANLEKNSGRTLARWIKLVQDSGLAKHGEIVALLKTKHALGHGYANLVVHMMKQGDAPAPAPGADPADEWFAGDKAAMRPVYDAVLAIVKKFGRDIEYAPKKGYMSLRRSKQFACVQASTKNRVDVGLQLKGVAPAGRLEAAGSWNAMVTRRVRLENVAQVDKELAGWLQRAYDAA